MQHPDDTGSEAIKPDLKHDTMEYNAASEGDDVLDTDKETPLELEEESITAEELSSLEDDAIPDQEAAFVSAENDSLSDEDNYLNEPDAKVEDPIISEDNEYMENEEEGNERRS
ncbi:MAG: hypothetical protein ABIN67_13440 [Ferruginibacter sp.]